MALKNPYKAPVRLDVGRVETLLRAKAAAAEDHIWQLREDPTYFAETLHEFMKHRQDMLKDTTGRKHPSRILNFENTFWARVLSELVVDALS
ncbi:hypothetical protein HJFPF1_12963 [Paramyrothecium foliicola]|nr:hypothetical protein HJFPF1_12963 [Paramyrothecium foliicola]